MLKLDLSKIKDYYTREIFKQIIATYNAEIQAAGEKGDKGEPGESLVNIDGGDPFSIYGGIDHLDGGEVD